MREEKEAVVATGNYSMGHIILRGQLAPKENVRTKFDHTTKISILDLSTLI